MNKGDFLNYIVLHCCKSIMNPEDCCATYCNVHNTSRSCRNLFTWDTHHFEELLPEVMKPVAKNGDVYVMCVYKRMGNVIFRKTEANLNRTYRHSVTITSSNTWEEMTFVSTSGIVTFSKCITLTPDVVKEKIIK